MRIGIIGRGFVGGSIEKHLKNNTYHDVKSFDVNDNTTINDGYKYIVCRSEIIYLCLPTPMDSEGRCCTDIVDNAVSLIDYYSKKALKKSLVLLKSTMVPNTTDGLNEKYKNVICITNPEFLTERTAYEDMVNAKTHVLGFPEKVEGKEEIIYLIENFHKNVWPDADIYNVSSTEAELIKYMTNTFYALKVTYANHIYMLAHALGIDYSAFIESAVASDPRLGDMHWNVPGPDGNLGFGGKCFPKDLNGMIKLFEENNLNCDMLKSVWEYNSNIREQKDWLKILGAVI